MKSFSLFQAVQWCLGAMFVSACAGGTDPVPPGQTPAISIAIPSPVNVAQTASGSLEVVLTRSGSFSGPVSLTTTGAPAGVTVAPGTIAAGSTTGSLGIQVGSTVTPGTFNLAVNAQGVGVAAATASAVLTVTALPSPTLQISVDVAEVTVTRGSAATATITLTRGGGFTGPVQLQATGLPAGVTASWSIPNPVSANTVTMTIAASASAAIGRVLVTVIGTAVGVANQSAQLGVTVADTPVPTLQVGLNPSEISVARGAVGTSTISFVRGGGFTGGITLTPGPLPAGFTLSLNPPVPITANSATLTIAVGANAALGRAPISFTVTGAGVSAQTVTLGVTVIDPTISNIQVDYSRCASRPIWLAYQDGTGPWTRASESNGTYTLPIASARGGIAVVYGNGRPVVRFLTRTEMVTFGVNPDKSCRIFGAKTLTANISGLSFQQLTLGIGWASERTNANQTISIRNVPDGVFDLMGYSADQLNPLVGDLVFFQRNINTSALANGSSLGTFEPNKIGTPLATTTFQLENVAPDIGVNSFTAYLTGASCSVVYTSPTYPLLTLTPTMFGIPPNLQMPEDRHLMQFTGTDGLTRVRYVTESFNRLTPRVVSFGSHLPAVTPTTVTGPYRRLNFAFTVPPDLEGGHAQVVLGNATGTGKFTVIVSVPGYYGGRNIVIETPDLSAAAGWDPAWGIPATSAVDWQLFASNNVDTLLDTGAVNLEACTLSRPVLSAARTGRF